MELKNKKVLIETESDSRLVQEKAFSLGYKWIDRTEHFFNCSLPTYIVFDRREERGFFYKTDGMHLDMTEKEMDEISILEFESSYQIY